MNMKNLGRLIFILKLWIIVQVCSGQKGGDGGVPIKDQNNGPAFQDNDNVNLPQIDLSLKEPILLLSSYIIHSSKEGAVQWCFFRHISQSSQL